HLGGVWACLVPVPRSTVFRLLPIRLVPFGSSCWQFVVCECSPQSLGGLPEQGPSWRASCDLLPMKDASFPLRRQQVMQRTCLPLFLPIGNRRLTLQHFSFPIGKKTASRRSACSRSGCR